MVFFRESQIYLGDNFTFAFEFENIKTSISYGCGLCRACLGIIQWTEDILYYVMLCFHRTTSVDSLKIPTLKCSTFKESGIKLRIFFTHTLIATGKLWNASVPGTFMTIKNFTQTQESNKFRPYKYFSWPEIRIRDICMPDQRGNRSAIEAADYYCY